MQSYKEERAHVKGFHKEKAWTGACLNSIIIPEQEKEVRQD
jgi:hypothetical protein